MKGIMEGKTCDEPHIRIFLVTMQQTEKRTK